MFVLLSLASAFVLSLLWYDPFAYLAVRFYRCEAEISCDEASTDGGYGLEKEEYGASLLSVIQKTACGKKRASTDLFSSKSELDDILSSYFRDYKRQKVAGCIEDRFAEMVRDLAEDRPQFVLPSREDILESIGSANVVLCWVDALGCEFLGFIQAAAERFGLKIKVTPARAKLPSITSVNRGFFDDWQGMKMQPVGRIDKIKHGDFERANPEMPSNVAAELPHELAVLDETMRSIAATLRKNIGRKVVLTGDHGATRLAVLSGRETVWEMPEKGKHHGRCCRKSEFKGVLPPCVTESDDETWHVLAGYDRFKGGRMGDVEVHGGATIEEMVVPVVEFTANTAYSRQLQGNLP